jgi:hypothetical protein
MEKLNLKLRVMLFALCGVAFAVSCDKDEAGVVAPAVPAGLKATDIITTAARLSWTGNAPEFEVKVGDKVATVAMASYDAVALTPNTAYTWSVRAKRGDAFSEWAAGSFSTAAIAPEHVPEPLVLKCTNITKTGATLSWIAGAGVLSYELQVAGAPCTVTGNSFTVDNLASGASYSWRIRARGAETYSEWVSGPSFTTRFATPPPSPGAEITFGNHVWRTVYSAATILYDDKDTSLQIRLFGTDVDTWGPFSPANFQYPWMVLNLDTTKAGRYSLDDYEKDDKGNPQGPAYDVEYYHAGYFDVYKAIGKEPESEGDFYVIGDYWMEAASSVVEITAIDTAKVSGVVTVIMGETPVIWRSDGVDLGNAVPLTVTFEDLPLRRVKSGQ